jgi:hypothetical protein
MLNNYAIEVFKVGGEALLALANKEFKKGFFIVARTPEYIVLGDNEKNVKFDLGSKIRISEKYIFDKRQNLERKR